jgi:hypothetical protein
MPFDSFEDLFILKTGEPAIDTHRTDNEGEIIRALDGTRVKIAERWRHEAASSTLPALAQRESDRHLLSWNRRLRKLEGPTEFPVAWYFLHDGKRQGHGCFVGYDKRSRHAVGYIGRNGFTADAPAPDDQFPIGGDDIMMPFDPLLRQYFLGERPYALFPGITQADVDELIQPWTTYLLADDGLVQINLQERTVQYLRKDSNILSAAMAIRPTPLRAKSVGLAEGLPRNAILLRNVDRVEQINLRGKSTKTYPLPEELQNLNLLWHELQDGTVLVRTGYGPGIWNNELFWIDNNGKIVRHEKIELNQRTGRPGIIEDIGTFVIGICPGLLVAIVLAVPSEYTPISRSLDYSVALAQVFADVWPILATMSAVACALALLCYRRQRKYGQPNAWGWAAFVLLLGVPGYLGYLAHRAWPTRLPCFHCGKSAPRDRSACFTCGRDFPPPSPKGIEVFA